MFYQWIAQMKKLNITEELIKKTFDSYSNTVSYITTAVDTTQGSERNLYILIDDRPLRYRFFDEEGAGGKTIELSNYFQDWHNPTVQEIILFELEHYPIKYLDYYLGIRDEEAFKIQED